MKPSKELSSRLCPLGDVSLPATRWGVSGAASRVSDVARVSGGSRGGASPGVFALACRAGLARGTAPARPVADGRWRPSSHLVSGIGPSCSCQAGQRSIPRRFRVPLCLVGRHAVLPAGPLPRQVPPLVLALLSVVGVPAFLPRPPWAPRVAVGLAVQAARLHRSSVALPLGRCLPTRAAARVGFPGPRAAGRLPGRWCLPGPGQGPGGGLGDREMTVLRASPSAWLLGHGVAGAPVWRVSWRVGPRCRTLPEPGGLAPGQGCGGARCRRAGRWRCLSG